jgi:HAD superfamily phosphoserine phosphatase-like hydrolase
MEEIKERERHARSTLTHSLEKASTAEKLALFDMDGVLLDGRFIRALARETSREQALSEFLDAFDMKPAVRMRRIANVFKGVPKQIFERVAMQIPLMKGALDTVVSLRKSGYRVGIVTDSYQVVAEIVRRRVFADFSLAHMMRFQRGKATGRVTLCPAMIHPSGCPEHDHCKVNVLHHLTTRLNLPFENIMAIGDGENDTCMLRMAGTSFAFQPKTARVAESAQREIKRLSEITSNLFPSLHREISCFDSPVFTVGN